jgi:hypothetical protein
MMQVKINKVKQNNNKVKDVRAKTPLAEVFHFSPRQRRQKKSLMRGE